MKMKMNDVMMSHALRVASDASARGRRHRLAAVVHSFETFIHDDEPRDERMGWRKDSTMASRGRRSTTRGGDDGDGGIGGDGVRAGARVRAETETETVRETDPVETVARG